MPEPRSDARMLGYQPAAPANGHKAKRVVYPYSDGKPMGESPDHVAELMRSFLMLQDRFASDARVYVGADMFLYYEQGNPSACVAPDLFVAKGVSKTRRRTSYRLWREGVAPGFVLELTSPSTAAEDRHKAEVYARLGVREYVLFDPRPEAREEPSTATDLLLGYRLGANGYEPIAADPNGGLASHALGLRLVDDAGRLQWYDLASGVRLLDPYERAAAADTRAAAAEARVIAANTRAAAADAQAAAADTRAASAASRAAAAEARAAAEAEARRAAEARLAVLEALIRQARSPDN